MIGILRKPSVRISAALTLIVLNIVVVADLLDLVPDPTAAVGEQRKVSLQHVARTVQAFLGSGSVSDITPYLVQRVDSDPGLLAAQVTTPGGGLLGQAGPIGTDATARAADQLEVPLSSNGEPVAIVRLVFAPLGGIGAFAWAGHPLVRMSLFIGVVAFLGFEFFLRRTLRHLDPTRLMPERVRVMMDALAEGIVLIGPNQEIVMSNTSFARHVNRSVQDLPGMKLTEFRWHRSEAEQHLALPWMSVMESGSAQHGRDLVLEDGHLGRRHFAVNCTPIQDAAGKIRGALATFDDQTGIMQTNEELKGALKTLAAQREEIERQNKELRLLATRDPLTGCLNRRAFFEVFEQEIRAARARSIPLSCIMCDIDHFKGINDTFGHSTGDKVIKRLAEVLIGSLRENDYVCRYGGEEFCLLLPGIGLEQAVGLAERIRAAVVEENNHRLKLSEGRKVTSSFGVSALEFGATDLADLIDQADQALYHAKKNGRNRVSSYAGALDAA